ncbi:MAG: hypothetical protein RIB64_21910 [Arenibacter algicola]
MIKISRDNFPPSDKYLIGVNRGCEKWRVVENKVLVDYKSNPLIFQNGTYSFPRHPSYDSWKEELLRAQGIKCCYCEKPINRGDLEHYRPKQGWQQAKGNSFNRPGYYWLAYRWKNLLLSCSECNESATKGNLFPIQGTRATTPRCNLNAEHSTLLNPYNEEPSNSISFYKSDPIAINNRGKVTIDIFKLKDRGDLAPIRKDRFDMYELAKSTLDYANKGHIKISRSDLKELQTKLYTAQKAKKPFSGMIKENLRQGFL